MSLTATSSRRGLASRLSGAFETWRGEPFWSHLGAVLFLVLVAVLRYWTWLSWDGPLTDEISYLGAFRQVADGNSPYSESSFLYPSVIAHVGAWSIEQLGEGLTLAAMRLLNLLGLSAAVWCAMAWLPWSRRYRLIAGITVVLISPLVRYSIFTWNFSLLVSGMLIVGLLLWPSRPVMAGVLLGACAALKPIAPVAILALLCHRPLAGGRQHQVAALVSIGVAAALVLGFPGFGHLASLSVWERLARTVSLHRFIYLLGWGWAVLPLVAVIAGVTVVLVRIRPLGPTHLLVLATTATLAATPLVWGHTLLVSLPTQVLALTVAWSASGYRLPAARAGRFELVLVVLGVAALQFAEGPSGIDDQAVLIQWLGTAATALAPAALTGYFFRRTVPF